MTEHPNATLLRRIYDGDGEALFEKIAPEYVCHTPGQSLVSGDYFGEAHRELRAKFMSLTNGTIRKELCNTFLANDEWAIVPSRLKATRNGKTLDVQGFGIWRFRNGLIAEHWGLTADQAAFDAFFL